MAISLITYATERGLPSPPIDPFAEKVYDVPYPNSRSMQFAIWFGKCIIAEKRDLAVEAINKVAQSRGIKRDFKNVFCYLNNQFGENRLERSFGIAVSGYFRWLCYSNLEMGPRLSLSYEDHLVESFSRGYELRKKLLPLSARIEIFTDYLKESLLVMDEPTKTRIKRVSLTASVALLTLALLFLSQWGKRGPTLS